MLRAAGAAVLATLAAAAAAGAATAPLPPRGALLLAPADLGRYAKIGSDRTTTAAGLTEYIRGLTGGTVAGTPLAGAASVAIVASDASTAYVSFEQFEAAAHTRSGRAELGKGLATGFAAGVAKEKQTKALHVLGTTVGTPRFAVDTIVLPVTMKTNLGSIRMPIVLTHVDRVLGVLALLSFYGHKVPDAAVDAATAAMRKRLTAAFTVVSAAPPTISGSPAQGQTLTVDEGSWSGAPTSYSYAWSRCTGGTCTPVAGATGRSYVVGAADAGSTLQVAVTAENTVGSATATAAPTPPVQ